MINRYQGNSGKYTRVEEGGRREPPQSFEQARSPQFSAASRPLKEVQQRHSAQNPGRGGIFEKLTKLIPAGASQLGQLETEDIILLLILYLMYRESGDSELLMIMGAMFLM